jgi:hypothetical protein
LVPLVAGPVEPLGPLEQGLLETSGVTVAGHLKQGLVSIAPFCVALFQAVKWQCSESTQNDTTGSRTCIGT